MPDLNSFSTFKSLKLFKTVTKFWLIGCSGLVLLLLLLLQTHNIFSYPRTRGFDALAHIEYVDYLRLNHRLPLPANGWEFSQPPLYYAVMAIVPAWVSEPLTKFMTWALLLGIFFIFARDLITYKPLKNNVASILESQVLIVVLLSSIPVFLYLAPAISNELFSTMIFSATLVYVFKLRHQKQTVSPIGLGILFGASLLSKATSLVLFLALFLDTLTNFLLTKPQKKTSYIKPLSIALILGLTLGGWFYFRNLRLYGNPVFQAADYVPLADYDQPIIPRTWRFLWSPEGFLTTDLFAAHHHSFLAGTYFSWFYDGHAVLLPPQAFTKLGLLLVIWSLPLFLVAVLGFLVVSKQLFIDRNQTPYSLAWHYTVCLLGAYLQYNFRLPFYSTVKGAFISSLLIPFGYFWYQGLELIISHLPTKSQRLAFVLTCGYVFLFSLAAIKHFWINPAWYLPH